jgi:hypothetical protein
VKSKGSGHLRESTEKVRKVRKKYGKSTEKRFSELFDVSLESSNYRQIILKLS